MIWPNGFPVRRCAFAAIRLTAPAVAHAVRDDVHRSGAAPLGEVGHEIGDDTFARLDRRFVGRITASRSLRRPAEERHCAFDRQVEPDLRRAQRRILERNVVAVYED